MATAEHRDEVFPHIDIRLVAGRPQPYLPGTGLAVWEIVWLSRVYRGDIEALVTHLELSPALIDEALEYARVYPDEIERTVKVVEEDAVERLREKLPGIQVVSLGIDRGTSRYP